GGTPANTFRNGTRPETPVHRNPGAFVCRCLGHCQTVPDMLLLLPERYPKEQLINETWSDRAGNRGHPAPCRPPRNRRRLAAESVSRRAADDRRQKLGDSLQAQRRNEKA